MPKTQSATIEVRNLLGSLTDYEAAWDLQREVHTEIVDGTRPNTLILVEHPPVFTAGKRTQPEDRPTDGTPVIDVDRGGRITWHGPGQLVGYPLVTLPSPVDVMDFVHRLEQAIMDVCASFGIATERVADRTGVWVAADDRGPARKIAAIGVRVAKGVTMHGFSLNCNNDLSWYERIVPCGIQDAGVTTLSRELGREITINDVEELVTSEMIKQLQGWAL
jgi:lipoyl(octanoyl) transferase